MQNDQIGHQVIVLYELDLLVTQILLNDAVVVEKDPLQKVVELLALGGTATIRDKSDTYLDQVSDFIR